MGEPARARSGADDDDLMRSTEFAAEVAHQRGRVQAKQTDQHPAKNGKASQERAAEIEAEEEFKEDDGNEAYRCLIRLDALRRPSPIRAAS